MMRLDFLYRFYFECSKEVVTVDSVESSAQAVSSGC